jgi:hypothetical protein
MNGSRVCAFFIMVFQRRRVLPQRYWLNILYADWPVREGSANLIVMKTVSGLPNALANLSA